MLANVVADNFEEFDSIDWHFVKSFKEFDGHTITSLRKTFFSNIYDKAKKHSKGDKNNLTLKDIAEDAAVTYGIKERKIPPSTLKRQREVIEHFENKVKELGIKDFL